MQSRLRCVQIGCRVGKSAVDCSRQTTNRADCRQGKQHQKQCVLSQILAFFFLPQSCEKTLHVRSLPGTSTYMSRTTKVSGPVGTSSRSLGPVRFVTRHRLRLVQLRGIFQGRVRICESAVDCGRETADRPDCRQGEQDQQQGVFREVLAFLFFPKPHQKVFHEFLSSEMRQAAWRLPPALLYAVSTCKAIRPFPNVPLSSYGYSACGIWRNLIEKVLPFVDTRTILLVCFGDASNVGVVQVVWCLACRTAVARIMNVSQQRRRTARQAGTSENLAREGEAMPAIEERKQCNPAT